MAKFYTLGCYTAKGLGGFVSNPSTDRKAATSALAASVGAKVTQYSGLRGKYDFMAVIEGTFEQAAAAAMVAVSSGAVSDFTILEDVNLNEIAKIKKIGHKVVNKNEDNYMKGAFGGYQAIMKKDGVLYGASESRKDGHASGY